MSAQAKPISEVVKRRLKGYGMQQENGSYLIYDGLLQHLNFCASEKNHPVIRPRNPIYLDAVIGAQDLVTGVIPRVGRKEAFEPDDKGAQIRGPERTAVRMDINFLGQGA